MNCDAQSLVTAAGCIECGLPMGLMMPALIAAAVVVAGVSSDPQTLVSAARCYECIPTGAQLPVAIVIACSMT